MKTLAFILVVLVVIEAFVWVRTNRALVYRVRRRAFWGLTHVQSVVRMRRRVVVVALILSVTGAVFASVTARRVYGARVLLQVPDLCGTCHTVHSRLQGCPSPYAPE
jgi:hypothetical protein